MLKAKTEDEIFEEMWTQFLEHLKEEYPSKLDREIIASNAFGEIALRAKIISELWEDASEINGLLNP